MTVTVLPQDIICVEQGFTAPPIAKRHCEYKFTRNGSIQRAFWVTVSIYIASARKLTFISEGKRAGQAQDTPWHGGSEDEAA